MFKGIVLSFCFYNESNCCDDLLELRHTHTHELNAVLSCVLFAFLNIFRYLM